VLDLVILQLILQHIRITRWLSRGTLLWSPGRSAVLSLWRPVVRLLLRMSVRLISGSNSKAAVVIGRRRVVLAVVDTLALRLLGLCAVVSYTGVTTTLGVMRTLGFVRRVDADDVPGVK
jgi:hypothetical protein